MLERKEHERGAEEAVLRVKRGRPSTGFDKKAYDARRMREIRAGTWVKRLSSPKPIPQNTIEKEEK